MSSETDQDVRAIYGSKKIKGAALIPAIACHWGEAVIPSGVDRGGSLWKPDRFVKNEFH